MPPKAKAKAKGKAAAKDIPKIPVPLPPPCPACMQLPDAMLERFSTERCLLLAYSDVEHKYKVQVRSWTPGDKPALGTVEEMTPEACKAAGWLDAKEGQRIQLTNRFHHEARLLSCEFVRLQYRLVLSAGPQLVDGSHIANWQSAPSEPLASYVDPPAELEALLECTSDTLLPAIQLRWRSSNMEWLRMTYSIEDEKKDEEESEAAEKASAQARSRPFAAWPGLMPSKIQVRWRFIRRMDGSDAVPDVVDDAGYFTSNAVDAITNDDIFTFKEDIWTLKYREVMIGCVMRFSVRVGTPYRWSPWSVETGEVVVEIPEPEPIEPVQPTSTGVSAKSEDKSAEADAAPGHTVDAHSSWLRCVKIDRLEATSAVLSWQPFELAGDLSFVEYRISVCAMREAGAEPDFSTAFTAASFTQEKSREPVQCTIRGLSSGAWHVVVVDARYPHVGKRSFSVRKAVTERFRTPLPSRPPLQPLEVECEPPPPELQELLRPEGGGGASTQGAPSPLESTRMSFGATPLASPTTSSKAGLGKAAASAITETTAMIEEGAEGEESEGEAATHRIDSKETFDWNTMPWVALQVETSVLDNFHLVYKAAPSAETGSQYFDDWKEPAITIRDPPPVPPQCESDPPMSPSSPKADASAEAELAADVTALNSLPRQSMTSSATGQAAEGSAEGEAAEGVSPESLVEDPSLQSAPSSIIYWETIRIGFPKDCPEAIVCRFMPKIPGLGVEHECPTVPLVPFISPPRMSCRRPILAVSDEGPQLRSRFLLQPARVTSSEHLDSESLVVAPDCALAPQRGHRFVTRYQVRLRWADSTEGSSGTPDAEDGGARPSISMPGDWALSQPSQLPVPSDSHSKAHIERSMQDSDIHSDDLPLEDLCELLGWRGARFELQLDPGKLLSSFRFGSGRLQYAVRVGTKCRWSDWTETFDVVPMQWRPLEERGPLSPAAIAPRLSQELSCVAQSPTQVHLSWAPFERPSQVTLLEYVIRATPEFEEALLQKQSTSSNPEGQDCVEKVLSIVHTPILSDDQLLQVLESSEAVTTKELVEEMEVARRNEREGEEEETAWLHCHLSGLLPCTRYHITVHACCPGVSHLFAGQRPTDAVILEKKFSMPGGDAAPASPVPLGSPDLLTVAGDGLVPVQARAALLRVPKEPGYTLEYRAATSNFAHFDARSANMRLEFGGSWELPTDKTEVSPGMWLPVSNVLVCDASKAGYNDLDPDMEILRADLPDFSASRHEPDVVEFRLRVESRAVAHPCRWAGDISEPCAVGFAPPRQAPLVARVLSDDHWCLSLSIELFKSSPPPDPRLLLGDDESLEVDDGNADLELLHLCKEEEIPKWRNEPWSSKPGLACMPVGYGHRMITAIQFRYMLERNASRIEAPGVSTDERIWRMAPLAPISSTTISGTTCTLDVPNDIGLQEDGIYFFQLRVGDGARWSAWSPTSRPYVYRVPPPAIPFGAIGMQRQAAVQVEPLSATVARVSWHDWRPANGLSLLEYEVRATPVRSDGPAAIVQFEHKAHAGMIEREVQNLFPFTTYVFSVQARYPRVGSRQWGCRQESEPVALERLSPWQDPPAPLVVPDMAHEYRGESMQNLVSPVGQDASLCASSPSSAAAAGSAAASSSPAAADTAAASSSAAAAAPAATVSAAPAASAAAAGTAFVAPPPRISPQLRAMLEFPDIEAGTQYDLEYAFLLNSERDSAELRTKRALWLAAPEVQKTDPVVSAAHPRFPHWLVRFHDLLAYSAGDQLQQSLIQRVCFRLRAKQLPEGPAMRHWSTLSSPVCTAVAAPEATACIKTTADRMLVQVSFELDGSLAAAAETAGWEELCVARNNLIQALTSGLPPGKKLGSRYPAALASSAENLSSPPGGLPIGFGHAFVSRYQLRLRSQVLSDFDFENEEMAWSNWEVFPDTGLPEESHPDVELQQQLALSPKRARFFRVELPQGLHMQSSLVQVALRIGDGTRWSTWSNLEPVPLTLPAPKVPRGGEANADWIGKTCTISWNAAVAPSGLDTAEYQVLVHPDSWQAPTRIGALIMAPTAHAMEGDGGMGKQQSSRSARMGGGAATPRKFLKGGKSPMPAHLQQYPLSPSSPSGGLLGARFPPRSGNPSPSPQPFLSPSPVGSPSASFHKLDTAEDMFGSFGPESPGAAVSMSPLLLSPMPSALSSGRLTVELTDLSPELRYSFSILARYPMAGTRTFTPLYQIAEVVQTAGQTGALSQRPPVPEQLSIIGEINRFKRWLSASDTRLAVFRWDGLQAPTAQGAAADQLPADLELQVLKILQPSRTAWAAAGRGELAQLGSGATESEGAWQPCSKMSITELGGRVCVVARELPFVVQQFRLINTTTLRAGPPSHPVLGAYESLPRAPSLELKALGRNVTKCMGILLQAPLHTSDGTLLWATRYQVRIKMLGTLMEHGEWEDLDIKVMNSSDHETPGSLGILVREEDGLELGRVYSFSIRFGDSCRLGAWSPETSLLRFEAPPPQPDRDTAEALKVSATDTQVELTWPSFKLPNELASKMPSFLTTPIEYVVTICGTNGETITSSISAEPTAKVKPLLPSTTYTATVRGRWARFGDIRNSQGEALQALFTTAVSSQRLVAELSMRFQAGLESSGVRPAIAEFPIGGENPQAAVVLDLDPYYLGTRPTHIQPSLPVRKPTAPPPGPGRPSARRAQLELKGPRPTTADSNNSGNNNNNNNISNNNNDGNNNVDERADGGAASSNNLHNAFADTLEAGRQGTTRDLSSSIDLHSGDPPQSHQSRLPRIVPLPPPKFVARDPLTYTLKESPSSVRTQSLPQRTKALLNTPRNGP